MQLSCSMGAAVHCTCCSQQTPSSEIYVQAHAYRNIINFVGSCQVPSLFPLVTSLSSNVTKVFNTHDKAGCKSVQRVKDLGDGTFKSMTRLLGLPTAVALKALDLQLASVPFYQLKCLQEISFSSVLKDGDKACY